MHINIWGLHHDPQLWPEPDAFRPERFLPEEAAAADRHPNAFMPFGAPVGAAPLSEPLGGAGPFDLEHSPGGLRGYVGRPAAVPLTSALCPLPLPRLPAAPAGLGPRMCIGWKFAEEELSIALVRLYQAFTFSLPPGTAGKPLPLRFGITLAPEGGLPVIPHPRR